MIAYYRNKDTGEIREVEQDSQEFYDLQADVSGVDGHSKWEQTSFAHAQAIKTRASESALNEEDLGKEDKVTLRNAAIELDASGVGPEENPHLALTPGEIEAGLTPAQKLDDLKAQFDEAGMSATGGVFARAADRIADEKAERPEAQQARGLRARAGGSDEREGAPTVSAPSGDAGPGTAQSGGHVPSAAGLGGSPAVVTGDDDGDESDGDSTEPTPDSPPFGQ